MTIVRKNIFEMPISAFFQSDADIQAFQDFMNKQWIHMTI